MGNEAGEGRARAPAARSSPAGTQLGMAMCETKVAVRPAPAHPAGAAGAASAAPTSASNSLESGS